MPQWMMASVLVAAAPLLAGARIAHAYIDLAPTLSKIIADAPTIAVVEVASYDRDKHIVTLQPLRSLKGSMPAKAIEHEVSPPGGAVPRQIMQWASPGNHAVLFSTRTTTLVCLGDAWYQVGATAGGVWKLGKDRPDLPLAYYGSLARLEGSVETLLANKGTVITVVAYSTDNEGAMFDIALNRQSLPGLVRVERIRATMAMPSTVFSAASNPQYYIGPGLVDEQDMPALLTQLKAEDHSDRAAAADDLRSLGRKAKEAAPALLPLLNDASARVRFAGAATLASISAKNTQGMATLRTGLTDPNVITRRLAASYAGFTGEAGAPLAEALTACLKDDDAAVRANALESISILGPVAAQAAPALVPLLDNSEMVIDVADALGRIGSAAEPALPRLAKLLDSSEPLVRWAGVRAMAQIGGRAAHPAVDFMVKYMRSGNANEVEGYNMMIYLALLGPVAQDAAGAIQSFRTKNPFLPAATIWALDPQNFPWNNAPVGFGGMPAGLGGGRGGPAGFPAGFGGGPPGMGGGGGAPGGMAGSPGNLQELIYVAYVNGLGARLAALSPKLASAIMNNTAGDVPMWGYKILNADAPRALAVLTPSLESQDTVMRERAAVALGYMGDGAESAKASLEFAIQRAGNERERRLMEWALRQVDGD